MTFEEYQKQATAKLNVYEVEITINQVKGYLGKPEKGEYFKKFNILAISEEAAIKKAERMLRWENHQKLDNKTFNVEHKIRLLVEEVEY
jgi:hypothetical protein